MSNYGALAIIALVPERKVSTMSELQLLIALETVTPDSMGYRHIGMKLLASKAGLPYETTRKTTRRLVAASLLFYVPGRGKGHISRWRVLFSLDRPKVSTGGHVTEQQRCPPAPPKVSTEPAKGVHVNSVTSTNANTGLKLSGLNQSGLPRAAESDAAAKLAADAELIRIIIDEVKNATGRAISADWAIRVKRTILDGREPGNAVAYIRQAIRAEPDPRTRFLPITRPGY